MKISKTLIAFSLFLIIGLSVGFQFFWINYEKSKPKLPVLGQVNDFTLTDISQNNFGLKDLLGDVWIINFFFTTCSDVCPMMTKHMAALHRTFEAVPEVTLVSVTVNPETDDAQTLAKYAQKYKANTRKWIFLTGSREAITDLTLKSFKMGALDEPVFHSQHLVLVDRYGYIRGYYDGTDQQRVNQLFKDAARLRKEN